MKITKRLIHNLLVFTILALTMFSSNLSSAQNYSWDYVKFSEEEDARLNNACLDDSDNVYACGSLPGFKRVLRRFNSAGDLQWKKDVSTLIDDLGVRGRGGIEYSKSKIYFVGRKGSQGIVLESGINSSDPTTTWEHLSSSSTSSNIYDIKLKDAYLYVVGSFGTSSSSSNTLTFDGPTPLTGTYRSAFIAKYSYPTKSLIWVKKIDGSDTVEAVNVDVDDSGNIFVTGHFRGTAKFYGEANEPHSFTSSSSCLSDIFLAKFNSSGDFDHVFGLKIDGILNQNWRSYDVEVNETNGAVYWANTGGVRAYDKNNFGDFKWSSDINRPYSLETNSCGDIYVTGEATTPAQGATCMRDFFAASLKDNITYGTIYWESTSIACHSDGLEALVDSNDKELFIGNYYYGIITIDNTYSSYDPAINPPNGNTDPYNGYFIGRIDDEACYACSNTSAPTNLQEVNYTLTWDPVPGAVSYVISSPGGNVEFECKECGIEYGYGISLAPITVTTNSYILPSGLAKECFLWQVTAICEDGSESPISSPSCYYGYYACNTSAPTNLQEVNYTLTWDPVPGAVSYIISSPGGNVDWRECCIEYGGVSIAPITVTTNSYILEPGLAKECFLWQVTAICEDGSESLISSPSCYYGYGDAKNGDGDDKDKVSIYPNPNNGDIEIKIEMENDENIKLNIHRFDGALIKTFEDIKLINGVLKLNLKSSLDKGLYFFTFEIKKEVITKKIIIE